MKKRIRIVFTTLTVMLSVLFVAACAEVVATETSGTVLGGGQVGVVLPGDPGPLPDLPDKPEPLGRTFEGCPPEGEGGDPDFNFLKNRQDDGAYYPVQFGEILTLPWPEDIERRDRVNWLPEDTAQVAVYEGIPVAVEGYIVGARESGPESTNCGLEDSAHVDWHVWLAGLPTDDRDVSIVTETTPRVRANHPAWTLDLMREIGSQEIRVRISGWLFMDPEHPDQVGKTRGTIWEIHPIMMIEVEQFGEWVNVDSLGQ